jgi:prophage regulatory protein
MQNLTGFDAMIEMEDGTPDKPGPRRMLSEKQVLEIVPVGRTTLYRMEKAGQFPKGSYISANRKIWFEDELIAWQNEVNGRGRGRRNHPTQSKS